MNSSTLGSSRRTFLKSTVALGLAGGLGFSSPLFAAGTIKPGSKAALIVVDVQNCFVDGGTLPVKGGAEVVPVINKLAPAFENIVVTQDWHTPGHASFATAHAGKKPFETTELSYGTQVLWPDHCVQGTDDAALHKDLKLPTAQVIIRKGFHKDVDSYSAFEEADRKTATGLGRLPQGTRHRHGFRDRAGDRFLCRLDRNGRTQAGFRHLRHRGRNARHRPQRLAGRRLEADGGRGRSAHPVRRHPKHLSLTDGQDGGTALRCSLQGTSSMERPARRRDRTSSDRRFYTEAPPAAPCRGRARPARPAEWSWRSPSRRSHAESGRAI